jgi:hypothetical protein
VIINPYRFASAADPLLTGLVAWYSMDEASGARADSHGNAPNLTDNNTVGSATGKISNAADFEASNLESLSIVSASAGDFDFDSDFTISCWVNAESLTTDHRVVDCFAGVGYRIFIESGDFFFDVGDGTTISRARDTTNPTIGAWHHLVVGWDSSDGRAFLYRDGGSILQGAVNTGPSNPVTAGSNFFVGALNGGASKHWDGLIDEFAVWSRVLAVDDRARLYNGGDGIGYLG